MRVWHAVGAYSWGLRAIQPQASAPGSSQGASFEVSSTWSVLTGAKFSSCEGHFGFGNLPGVIWHGAWGGGGEAALKEGAGLCDTSVTSMRSGPFLPHHMHHREGPWPGGQSLPAP